MSTRGKSKEVMAHKGKVKVVSVKSIRKESSEPPADRSPDDDSKKENE